MAGLQRLGPAPAALACVLGQSRAADDSAMKSRGGRTLSRRRLPVEPAFLTAIDAARRIEKAARCRSSMHNAPEKLRTRLLGAARGPRILRRRP